MIFIAPLVKLSLGTSTPQGFALMSSTSGRVDMILGSFLIGDLDLILCRSLNSNFQKQFKSAPMLWPEA
jgi:hypothetical protein